MKIGEKIKRIRIENDLTQEELADRSELSKGFISQLERDMTSPSIQSLTDILESLGTNLKDFFSDEGDDRVAFGPDDYFVKENKESGYTLEWIIPNAQKNMMEPIMLTFQPGGVFDQSEGHSGEEFGFVLSGNLVLEIGGKNYNIKKGETFYYPGSRGHVLRNESKRQAVALLVSAPPNF